MSSQMFHPILPSHGPGLTWQMFFDLLRGSATFFFGGGDIAGDGIQGLPGTKQVLYH